MKIPRGWMTNVLVLACSASFVLTYLLGDFNQTAIACGFIPARVADPSIFHMVDGAPDWAVPVWLTPISSLLVHGGWLHIIFDMAFLFVCGRFAEHVFGPWLTLAIFLLGAYGAAIVQWAVGPGEMAPVMGTAGAISALIGVNALLYSNQKVKALGPLSANMVRIIWLAAAWIALNIMLEIAVGAPRGLFGFGNSGTGTSVGGFIAGLLLTRPMLHLRFGRVKAVS